MLEGEFHQKLMELINYSEQLQTRTFKNWVMERTSFLIACAQDLKRTVNNFIEARTCVTESIEKIQALFCALESSLRHPISLSIDEQLKQVTQKLQIETQLPLSDQEDNQFVIEVYSILAFEQGIVCELLRSMIILKRSVILFQHLDLSPEIVTANLQGQRSIPRFLLVCSNMVESAAEAAKNSSDLVEVTRAAWKSLTSRAQMRMSCK